MAAPAPQKSDNPYFKPVMSGLAVGSGSFLLLRYAFGAAIDPSLIVAAFFGVAVAVFLAQRPK
ncbi:MAG TPA: hypothetical protein VNK52_10285 [Hyphomicrobiaceae bacterium]|nr:hypothetical protein [Hyphomicrobiaceae bacterium]